MRFKKRVRNKKVSRSAPGSEDSFLRETLDFLAQRGWAADVPFFDALVLHLTEATGVEFALIGELLPDDHLVRTVSLCANGVIAPGIEYDLAGTPCENVMGQQLCSYPSGIQERFPEDQFLVEMGANSYVGSPLWDSKGAPIGIVAALGVEPLENAQHVSSILEIVAVRAAYELERLRDERSLRESEAKFRSIVDQSVDGIVLVDHEGTIVLWNQGEETISGIPAADALGNKIWDIQFLALPQEKRIPEVRERFRQTVLQILRDHVAPWAGRFAELEIQRPDGERRKIQLAGFSIEGAGQSMAGTISRDITDLKEAEQHLRRNHDELAELVKQRTAELNTAVEAANAVTFHYDLVSDQLVLNERWREIVGVSTKEFPDSSTAWELFLHPEDRERVAREIDHALSSDVGEMRFECRLLRPDGEVRHIDSRSLVLRDEEGIATGLVGLNIDVSDRVRAEEALRENEAYLRTLMEHMPIDFFALDKNMRYTMQSALSRAVIGDAIGTRVQDSDAPAELKAAWVQEHQQVLSGKTIRREYHIPLAGDTRTFMTTVAPVSVGDEIVGTVGTSMDITDRTRMEDELRRARDELETRVAERTQELRASEQQLLDVLEGTIAAFAQTVETRDPYTAGHQEHVANLAVEIAQKLCESEECVEATRVAGLLHDIGKISIPSEILTKPTELLPVERQMIQQHSTNAYYILEGVGFPWPIAKIVLQHHERMDGTGYPNGTRGEDILIEARILAVADTVEATAAHRPYRAALGIDAALEVIRKGRETIFDPRIVDACIELFERDGFTFDAEV